MKINRIIAGVLALAIVGADTAFPENPAKIGGGIK